MNYLPMLVVIGTDGKTNGWFSWVGKPCRYYWWAWVVSRWVAHREIFVLDGMQIKYQRAYPNVTRYKRGPDALQVAAEDYIREDIYRDLERDTGYFLQQLEEAQKKLDAIKSLRPMELLESEANEDLVRYYKRVQEILASGSIAKGDSKVVQDS